MHRPAVAATHAIAFLVLLLAISACAGDRRSSAPREPVSAAPTPSAPADIKRADAEPAAAAMPRPWDGAASVLSNAGTYRVVYKTAPSAIPRGEPFAIDVWVFLASAPDRPLSNVRVLADAAMPEHGHGMNRLPRIEQHETRFRVEGMLFHMPGYWQLYLDVTSGALTERAQVDVDLE